MTTAQLAAITITMANTDWRQRLATAIEKSGRSPRDLSIKIGRSEGYVRSLLQDGKEPGVDTFKRLCEELGVSPMWILYGTDDKDPETARVFAAFSAMNADQRKSFLVFLKTFAPDGDPKAE